MHPCTKSVLHGYEEEFGVCRQCKELYINIFGIMKYRRAQTRSTVLPSDEILTLFWLDIFIPTEAADVISRERVGN